MKGLAVCSHPASHTVAWALRGNESLDADASCIAQWRLSIRQGSF